MSSLIFYVDENQVLAATDTLAVSDQQGTPFLFTTKTFLVPHLNMLICGTGLGGFLGQWFIQINDRMIVGDVDDLDFHTPGELNKIWNGCNKNYSDHAISSSTVYHFGFSSSTGLMKAYAYRSTSNFLSESLPVGGISVKPECDVHANWELPRDFSVLMNRQRALQDGLSESERIYIGGEIILHRLDTTGYVVQKLGKFPDYDETQAAIYHNFDSDRKVSEL